MERYTGSWMSKWDDRILEYINQTGHGSPKMLEDTGHIHVSREQISRRLRTLRDYDLLRHLGNGIYVITDKGEAYLEGDLDAEELSPGDQTGNQSSRSASA